jgi:hypothetical protein
MSNLEGPSVADAETTTPENGKAVTLSAWKKAATHYPMLPSGSRVGIKVPDLPRMIEAGSIPQHLLEAAVGAARNASAADNESLTPEKIMQNAKEEREFTDIVTMLTVVEPKLSEADVAEVPFEDKQFLVALATRTRDLDAQGDHLAGLTKSEKFRRFRGLGEFDPTLEGA